MALEDSGNGKMKAAETATKNDKGLNFWSERTGTNIFFSKPPLLLTRFPKEVAEGFLRIGVDQHFETHDMILQKGQIGRDMFLIYDGAVSIANQGVNFATLRKGDVFGELILFRDHYRIASVRAEQSSGVLRYQRHVLMDFFARNDKKLFNIYMMNLIEILRRKLIMTNQKVVQLERALLQK